MADCFIMRKGINNNDKIPNSFINSGKVAGYFDMTSLDLSQNKWRNLSSSHNDIDLIGGSIEDNSLLLTEKQYGELTIYEPFIAYVVFKAKDLSEVNEWTPIFTKKMTQETSNYSYAVYLTADKNIAGSILNNDIVSNILPDNYHCVCLSRLLNNKVSLFIDGSFVGTTSQDSYMGYYSGKFLLNRCERGGYIRDTPVSIYYNSIVLCTEYHNEITIAKNSEYLLKRSMI